MARLQGITQPREVFAESGELADALPTLRRRQSMPGDEAGRWGAGRPQGALVTGTRKRTDQVINRGVQLGSKGREARMVLIDWRAMEGSKH